MTIDDDAIRYIALKSIDPLVVDIAEEFRIPPNAVVDGKIVDADTIVSIMDDAVEKLKISKRSVRFLAPDQYVVIRKSPYPEDVLDDELKSYFFLEIGSTIYLPFTDPVFDVVPYKPNTEQHEAIIIASQESILDQYEMVFEDAKLNPVEADITPLALYRLAHTQHKFTGKEHVMIADLKDGKLTVSILHEHYPLFMRPVDLENTADLSLIMDNDSNTVRPNAIVTEIQKLINFYRYNMLNGTATITHLLINGEYEFMNELVTFAQEEININVNLLLKRPLLLGTGQELPARFNRTIGLALKEV